MESQPQSAIKSKALILQHILEYVDDDMTLDLKIDDCDILISYKLNEIRVDKTLCSKSFDINDPEFAFNIIQFIKELQDTPIYIESDGAYRAIGLNNLKMIIFSNLEYRKKIDAIWDKSNGYHISDYSSNDFWSLGYDSDEFDTFVKDFKEAYQD